jgi:hypothetical protein
LRLVVLLAVVDSYAHTHHVTASNPVFAYLFQRMPNFLPSRPNYFSNVSHIIYFTPS